MIWKFSLFLFVAISEKWNIRPRNIKRRFTTWPSWRRENKCQVQIYSDRRNMKSGSLFLVIFVTIFTTTKSFTKHVSFSSLVGLYQWSQAHILNHWDPRQPLKPPDHWDIVIVSSQINENTSTNSPRFRVRWISQRSRGRGRFLETFLFFFNLSDLGIPGCPLQLFRLTFISDK